jgi:transposase
MRATTLFNTVLDLDGASVTDVRVTDEEVRVAVRLRRRRLLCPIDGCGFSTRWTADTRPTDSSWRSLDMDSRKVILSCRLRRLDCPDHGVLVEQVPFARHRTRFTRDFEDWSPGVRQRPTRPPSPDCYGSPG